MKRLHTFIAYVEDRPGVLNRVSSLFRRRGFNIASLTVGQTETPGVSRMTIVMEADEDTARRLEANLYKLVNVLMVEDVTAAKTILRDLMLVKVRADRDKRPEVLQLVEVFRGRVVDVAPEALIVELSGGSGKLDKFVEVLRPYGIVEMVRTGGIAMTRGESRDGQGVLREGRGSEPDQGAQGGDRGLWLAGARARAQSA